MTQKNVIPLLSLLQYGALALPLAFAGFPLYIYAPDLYSTYAGVSLGMIGALLMATRIIDAVQDPLIGKLSDDFSRYRLLIVGLGCLALGLGFSGVFNPPLDSPDKLFVAGWFFFFLVVTKTAFSILVINLNSLGSLWSRDKEQKTKITASREAFTLIGLLAAAALPQILFSDRAPSLAFAALSWGVLGAIAAGYIVFAYWMKNGFAKSEGAYARHRYKYRDFLKVFQGRKASFFIVFTVSMVASSMPSVLVIFFIRDYLQLGDQTGLLLFLYFLSGAVTMPFWGWAAGRFGKLKCWFSSMVLAVVTFIWAYFLGAGDFTAYALVCLLSGLSMGAELSIPPALLSDLLDEDETQYQTGAAFSVFAFLTKSAFALASFLALGLLGYGGFQPGGENDAQALHMLALTYALLPCSIKLLSAGLLYFYFPLFQKKKAG